MEGTMREHVEAIECGETQAYKHVGVIPLFCRKPAPIEYLVLREALEKGLLAISEVSEGGHVPELKVVNNADMPVLILDGEELSGAKQNRVLNTTVLVKEHSVTIIPVSCTEQGRWSYTTNRFTDSDVLMSRNLRSVKNRAVQESLHASMGYRSDQGAIWHSIRDQAVEARVHSPTQAMKDIHEEKKEDIEQYEEHFPSLPDQKGILVMIDGEVAGLDMVSWDKAYQLLHRKLVRSYVLDAILAESKSKRKPSSEKAQVFLKGMLDCEVKRFESVGHGWDLRFEGKRMFGSALEYRDSIIHMACFHKAKQTKQDDLAGYNRRANYRRRTL